VQWVQDPNQSNVYNLNTVIRYARKHFRNRKKEYLEAKIEELETNSKIKKNRDFYRSIIDFKNDYQPITNTAKDENGDLITYSRSILIDGGTISLSYSIYFQLMMLDRQKYIRQNHWCLSRVLLRLRWLSKR